MATAPDGPQFEFAEEAVFGEADLFCRRLFKLHDLFCTIRQFQRLAVVSEPLSPQLQSKGAGHPSDDTPPALSNGASQLSTPATPLARSAAKASAGTAAATAVVPTTLAVAAGARNRAHAIAWSGLANMATEFRALLADLRATRRDLLAYREGAFDRELATFHASVRWLEAGLGAHIDRCFEAAPDTAAALALLQRYHAALHRKSMRQDLDKKLLIVLQKYGLDLFRVRECYERQKARPPLPRNAPPVSGGVRWARNLLAKVAGPMDLLRGHYPAVLRSDDGCKIVKSYNQVQSRFLSADKAWLASLGVTLPPAAAAALRREPHVRRLYMALADVAARRRRLAAAAVSAPPPARPLLATVAALIVDLRLRDGLDEVTWSSIGAEDFAAAAAAALSAAEAADATVRGALA
ncbi:unnamed protein product, partial [Phaeothamnion confervicola]